jgi:hypothetical protein
MNLLLWGLTLGTIGKLILGIAVLRVHIRIFEEHSIDGVVLKAIKREYYITVLGLVLIALGYVLEVLFYNGSTQFLDCIGSECSGLIQAAFRQD